MKLLRDLKIVTSEVDFRECLQNRSRDLGLQLFHITIISKCMQSLCHKFYDKRTLECISHSDLCVN